MSAVFDSGQHIGPSGVGLVAAAAAIDAAADAAAERRRAAAQHAAAIHEVEEGHRSRLRGVLGELGYDEFRALRARPYTQLRLPGREPGSHLDTLGEQTDRRQRMEKLLAELQVSPERIRAVNRETIDQLAARPWLPALGEGAELVRPFDIPTEMRDASPRAWGIARAPYPDWSWWYDGWLARFQFAPTLFLNSATGEVGHHNYLWNNNATDFDHAQIEYNASVACWYQMPSNARLSIWIEAKAIETAHQLTVIDEWGVSDAFSWQENYLVAKADGVANDPWQKGMTSWWKYDGDSAGAWNTSYFAADQTVWVNLHTQAWFPTASWVRISAGTTSWHRATTNDMEVYSNMRFRWSIQSVWAQPLA